MTLTLYNSKNAIHILKSIANSVHLEWHDDWWGDLICMSKSKEPCTYG